MHNDGWVLFGEWAASHAEAVHSELAHFLPRNASWPPKPAKTSKSSHELTFDCGPHPSITSLTPSVAMRARAHPLEASTPGSPWGQWGGGVCQSFPSRAFAPRRSAFGPHWRDRIYSTQCVEGNCATPY